MIIALWFNWIEGAQKENDMIKEKTTYNKTELEKLAVAQRLQKDGMPAKVAAKLAGIPQSKMSQRI